MKKRLLASIVTAGAAVGAALWQTSSSEPPSADGTASHRADRSIDPRPPQLRSAPRRGHAVTVGDVPVDLGEVMARTRRAFHTVDGDQLVGGDTAYGVRVANGEIAIHPEAKATSKVGAPLRLRTTAIGRKGAMHTSHPYSLRDDGSVEASISSSITEQLHNAESGLEQAWTFEEPPDGSGDLVVHLAVAGEDFIGATDTGLHFRDPASGIGLSMSHARWVDAAGKATDIPLEYDHGEVAMVVPADLVDNAEYPAVLDPTVGPEYDVDTPIVGPTTDEQTPISIGHSAIAPYEFLVVWQDRRRSTDTDLTYDIFGAHVSRTGQVRESVGFMINDPSWSVTGHTDGNQTDPQVDWEPYTNRYIVLWSDDNGAMRLQYRMVDPATTALSSTHGLPDIITTDECHWGWNQSQPSLAVHSDSPNPDHVFVAWRETALNSSTGMICGADWIDDGFDGALQLHSGPLTLWDDTAGLRDASVPAVASVAWSLPDRFIIAFEAIEASTGKYNIYYKVYEDGQPLVPGRATPTSQTVSALNPSVATWGGLGAPYDGWLIAWEENDSTSILHPDYNIYGTLVDDTGGPYYQAFHINHSTTNQRMPSVAGYGLNDRQMFVAWTDSRSIAPSARGTRITLNKFGQPAVTDGPADTGSGVSMQGQARNGVAVHSDELGGYFAAWPDFRNGAGNDVYGANVPFSLATNGTVSNYIISQAANKETAPAVAQCSGKYLVAWTDTRNESLDGKDIYASLLNSDGTVAVQNIAISTAPSDQQHPVIGCQPTRGAFLVAWEDSRNGNADIYGTTVDTAGNVYMPNGLAIAATGDDERHPAIAGGLVGASTQGFAIAYEIQLVATNVVTIDANGNAVGGPFVVTVKGQTHGNGTYPDIGFDGANYVVVWEESVGGQHDIYGAELTPSLTLVHFINVDVNGADQRYPRIAFDPGSTNATVVYEDDRNGGSNGVDVYGQHINSGGQVGVPFPIAATTNDEYTPQVSARAGSAEEVTYTSIPQLDGFNFDVMGQSVAGTAVTGAAFAVSNSYGAREMNPGIACATLTCIVTYRWFSKSDTTVDIDRVKARVLSY